MICKMGESGKSVAFIVQYKFGERELCPLHNLTVYICEYSIRCEMQGHVTEKSFCISNIDNINLF